MEQSKSSQSLTGEGRREETSVCVRDGQGCLCVTTLSSADSFFKFWTVEAEDVEHEIVRTSTLNLLRKIELLLTEAKTKNKLNQAANY
ncbi:hypothetical protein Q5P01_013729 [Channa striata]|uniref:Uncharacterized protein n=1 Tax=Channa striata TaxID=64152 RepID=A0AA88MPK8_CHASR|nr:hypothetical protein Q5P01_013729 [Channa striata]